MGLISSGTTNISITAKLTPFGRQELLKKGSSIITHFALGDSDSYYGVRDALKSGEIPDISGKDSNSGKNNSTAEGYKPKSLLYYNEIGKRKKNVELGSRNVVSSKELIGYNTVLDNDLSRNKVSLDDYNNDSKVNWFYSFNLPTTNTDKTLFSATTSTNGGYSDTAYSGISQDNIYVIGVPSDEYAEMIDGKTVKLNVTGTSNNYEIYSTYENTLTNNSKLSAAYKELSKKSEIFGNNIAFLFSDDIQKPNGDNSSSWGSKYGVIKPFNNGKRKFNYKSDINTSKLADKPVGIIYLDKGLIVLTDPTIVSDLDGSNDNIEVNFNSVSTKVSQEVTCIIDRGEFSTTANKTFNKGDNTRISEIFLLNKNGNIIGVAKPDRHIEKTPQQFIALGIKITV